MCYWILLDYVYDKAYSKSYFYSGADLGFGSKDSSAEADETKVFTLAEQIIAAIPERIKVYKILNFCNLKCFNEVVVTTGRRRFRRDRTLESVFEFGTSFRRSQYGSHFGPSTRLELRV